MFEDHFFHIWFQEPKSNRFHKLMRREIKFLWWDGRSRSSPQTLKGHGDLLARERDLGKLSSTIMVGEE
jgi:hypothetical protein